MRLLVLLVLSIAAATSAIAVEEAKVQITSFNSAGSRTYAAEICGKVSGISGPAVVRILVDEKSNGSAQYPVFVDQDGPFCVSVVSYRGTASASIRILGKTITSLTATINSQTRD